MAQNLDGLKSIVNALTQKEIVSIEVVGKCDSNGCLRYPLTRYVELTGGIDHRISLVSLETSSYFPNVTEKNNTFYYYSPKSKRDETITLLPGAYEIKQYNEEIQIAMKTASEEENAIVIEVSEASARVRVLLKTGYKVYFDRDNTWRECLGFDSQELNKPINISDKIGNILPIQKIYVSCNLCNGSIVGQNSGRNTLKSGQILYSFPNTKRFGTPLTITPFFPREKQLGVKSFNEVELMFFSDDNEVIDFMGSQVSLELYIHQV